eukprot:15097655-Alexandrium_andersonii.AAC.1
MPRIAAGGARFAKPAEDGAPGWRAPTVKNFKPRVLLVSGPGEMLSTLGLSFRMTIQPIAGMAYAHIHG